MGGNQSIIDSSFNNIISMTYGSIWIVYPVELNISGCNFYNNLAFFGGSIFINFLGMISSNLPNASINKCIFISNSTLL